MNRDKDLVTLAMDSNAIVVVLVLVVGRELNINFFSDSSGYHAFLAVADLKVGSRRRENVQPLRGRRVVDETNLQGVSLPYLESLELDDRGACPENAIGAHVVVDI